MRPALAVAGVMPLAFAVITALPPVARADDTIATTYEIENLEAFPDKVFVAWPRTCGSTGDPLGAVSLQLNPDWVSRLHEVDYEVLDKGRKHEVLPYCLTTMRIHALPLAAFPRDSRVATVDDSALGKKPGETYAILPALDAIELPKRIPFFASDARRVSSPFRFDASPFGVRPDAGLVRAVHHVLAVDPTFTVQSKRVTYTYEQGPPQTVTAGAPDAGADAGVTIAAAPAPTSHDLGTRWVYAAAIGGLFAGGFIAHYRKKRAESAPK